MKEKESFLKQRIKEKWPLLLFLILVFCIKVIRSSNSSAFLQNQKTQVSIDEEAVSSSPFCFGDEKVLVDWVVKHSMWVGRYQVGVPRKVAEEFVRAACKTKHPFLILAIIKRESAFNPYLVSSTHAIGAAQISPVHWKELKQAGIISQPSDLFIPAKAVKACEFVFKEKIRESHGDIKQALYRYVGMVKHRYKARRYVLDVLETAVKLHKVVLAEERKRFLIMVKRNF